MRLLLRFCPVLHVDSHETLPSDMPKLSRQGSYCRYARAGPLAIKVALSKGRHVQALRAPRYFQCRFTPEEITASSTVRKSKSCCQIRWLCNGATVPSRHVDDKCDTDDALALRSWNERLLGFHPHVFGGLARTLTLLVS